MVYLVCFAISVWFAWLASKATKRRDLIAFSVISVFVVVALAGLRDYSIGIDTLSYMNLKRYWSGAIAYDSLIEYMQFYTSVGYGEPLFGLLMGVIAQLTGEFRIFLFVAHTVIVGGVYIGAFRQRKHVEPALVLLLFYLLYFNQSLNITRQYMAMAVIFAFFSDIEQKRHWRYCLAVLVATLIHNTAVIGVGPLLIYWVMYGDFSRLNPKFQPSFRSRQLFIVIGLFLLVVVFPTLCQFLIDSGILLKKYAFFLNPDEAEHATMATLFLLLELGVIFVLRKRMKAKFDFFDYFLICSVSYLILQQLSAFILYGKRISGYFTMGNMITIALIPQAFSKKTWKWIGTVGVVAVALFYWWYVFVLRNASQTMPYQFFFMAAQ